jgi:hypothetical protein
MTPTAIGNHDNCPACKVANRSAQGIFRVMVNMTWTPTEQALLERLAPAE